MTTAKAYGLFAKSLLNKEVDMDSDTIKAMLCTSAYTPNQDTHQYKSSITNEVTGTGYTAGGLTLAGSAVSYNASTNTLMFDANDASWPNSTITARYVVLYDATPGSDATRPLIGYVDLESDVSTTNGNFQVTWDAAGIITLTAA